MPDNSVGAIDARVLVRGVAFLCMLAVAGWALQLAAPPRSAEAAVPFGRSRVQTSSQLPVGLILPVRLNDTRKVKDLQKGTILELRVMQDIPLPDRGKIPMKSLVRGSVVSAAKDSDGPGVNVTFAFTQVVDKDQNFAIATSVRAIASYVAVRDAQTPWTGVDTGSPAGWSNTVQVGGDIRYGDGGPVRNSHKQKVGKGVLGGVLVHISANPKQGCEGPIKGEDYLQALWVFSSDACGVYGMKEVKLSHNGNSDPAGEITLHFEKDDMKLDAGTAFLLSVVNPPQTQKH
jgi:hypothetical protein